MWIVYNKDSNLNLCPIHLYHDECARGICDIIDKNVQNIGVFIKNDVVFSLCKKNEWESLGCEIVPRFKNNDFAQMICNKTKEFGEQIFEFAKHIEQKDIKTISKEELISIIDTYISLNKALYKLGAIINIAEHGGNLLVSKSILDILKNRLEKEHITNYFNIITTPLSRTMLDTANQEIARIAQLINNESFLLEDYGYKDYNLIKKHPFIYSAIDNFIKKHSWIMYGTQGPKITHEEIIDRVIYLANQGTGAIAKQIVMAEELETLKKKQDEIKKQLLPEEVSFIENSVQILMYKNYRKEYQARCHCAMDVVFNEISKSLNISPRILRFFTLDEIKNMILSETVSYDEIKKREEGVLYIYENGVLRFLVGQEAVEFFTTITNKTKNNNTDTKIINLHGMPIYKGKVVGKARIINNIKDLDTIKKNDILVSYTTNPQYTKVFDKIAGLLTEQGGLTSHAAIIAREYKIPCIVGVSGLLDSINNGDEIEINSFEGIIKKTGA